MYEKIAVTLDGSPLAEKALPYALRLANLLKANLLLLRIAELEPLLSDTSDHESEAIGAAQEYLDGVVEVITNSALKNSLEAGRVGTLVVFDRSEDRLAEIASLEGASLIIMSTHGRSGLSLLLAGSVSTRVIKHSALPVLLLRPTNVKEHQPLAELIGQSTSFDSDKGVGPIVLTVDTSEQSEGAIPATIELAAKLGVAVHLLSIVVPVVPVNFDDPDLSHMYDDETEEQRRKTREYLDNLQASLASKGVNSTTELRVGHVTDKVVSYASEVNASVLAMATHARGKIGQFLLGSSAEEATVKSHLPVLVVHIAKH